MGFLNPNPFSLKEKPVKLFKSTFSLKLFFFGIGAFTKKDFHNKLLFLKTFIIKIKFMGFLNPNPFSLKEKTHETF